jgi:hypothetical protein
MQGWDCRADDGSVQTAIRILSRSGIYTYLIGREPFFELHPRCAAKRMDKSLVTYGLWLLM